MPQRNCPIQSPVCELAHTHATPFVVWHRSQKQTGGNMHFVWRLALIPALFAAIGTPQSFAQSSSRQTVTNDRMGQYAIIRNMIDPRQSGKVPEGREPQNLGTCGDMELELGLTNDTDPTTAALVRIAGHYFKWENELPKLGYPRQTVLPLIAAVEKKLLARVASKGSVNFQDTLRKEATVLAQQLAAANTKLHLRARNVYFEDECGGGGILVEFKVPKDARLFYTSVFLARLCKAEGYDPSDRSTCDQWNELFNGDNKMLAGSFNYVGEWRDGTKRAGRFDADQVKRTKSGAVFQLER
jgi:hypothetical protein